MTGPVRHRRPLRVITDLPRFDMGRVLASRGSPLWIPGKSDRLDPAKSQKILKSPVLNGSFTPPRGTLPLGVDRQPDGFTCGPTTYEGIADFLRLPLRSPDQGLEYIRKDVGTSWKYGTEPQALAKAGRDHLGVDARVQKHMTIEELAKLVNGSARYVDALLRGAKPTKPLDLVMVTYQAYTDKRQRSVFLNGDAKVNVPMRTKDGSVIWQNDYDDGHYSAVVRVVLPNEHNVIRQILQSSKQLSYDDLKYGLVILADPSNALGLSFIPLPEFEKRWQDSNRQNQPVFPHTGIVFHVTTEKLAAMQRVADKLGVPMFSTVTRNSAIYVP